MMKETTVTVAEASVGRAVTTERLPRRTSWDGWQFYCLLVPLNMLSMPDAAQETREWTDGARMQLMIIGVTGFKKGI
jgi:hypothetical protein